MRCSRRTCIREYRWHGRQPIREKTAPPTGPCSGGWPATGAPVTLGLEGTRRYREAYELFAVNLESSSALTTALAFRHAIWRRPEPGWHMCGIPTVFHLDHGSDFTSAHLEQVMADLKVIPVLTLKDQPHGHGKIERPIGTINQMWLAHLSGYAPRGTPDRAGQAQLTLPGLDAAIGRFTREVYNLRPHSEP
jgi:transposase InsO family protein